MCDTEISAQESSAACQSIILSIPELLCRDVEAYADRHFISLSDAVRYLLRAGIDSEARAMLTAAAADNAI